MSEIEALLAEGRAERNAGNTVVALRAYQDAAEKAREGDATHLLLHAQRHVSDIARESGDTQLALSAASEAVSLASSLKDIPKLDQANALRVQALALEANNQPARTAWEAARSGYQMAGIADGVAECEEHLL